MNALRGSDLEGKFQDNTVSIDNKKHVVYVIEEGNCRISMFNTDGSFIDCFRSAEGEFNGPSCIAVNDSDNLFISDTNNDRIIVF